MEHPGGKLPNQVCTYPQCKTGNGHGQPTHPDWIHFGLNWSIEQNEHPVAIRIPCNGVISDRRTIDTNYSNLNKFKVEIKGENVAIIALGDFYQLGENVIEELKNKIGLNATLINPQYFMGQIILK